MQYVSKAIHVARSMLRIEWFFVVAEFLTLVTGAAQILDISCSADAGTDVRHSRMVGLCSCIGRLLICCTCGWF